MSMKHVDEGFAFKQFTVAHSRCAMKVGTDGVLLGAWVQLPPADLEEEDACALDIGTGSGLIALMLAQRFPQLTRITGIDISPEAVAQANDNFARSPWPERLHAMEADFRSTALADMCPAPFRLIVCNPPFFTGGQHMAAERAAARQSTTLPLPLLIAQAARLLQPAGTLAIIIPYEQATEAIVHAAAAGLFLVRRTDVRAKPDKPLTRTLLQWQANGERPPTQHSLLTLTTSSPSKGGGASPEYIALTHDFYLHL